jgi:hypothetical protein
MRHRVHGWMTNEFLERYGLGTPVEGWRSRKNCCDEKSVFLYISAIYRLWEKFFNIKVESI